MRSESSLDQLHIGIDLMGSDASPLVLFRAVEEHALKKKSSLHYHLYATQELLNEIGDSFDQTLITFHLCEQVITMDDTPHLALRKKKQSTMFTGLERLNQGKLDAFITAGNTAALIAKSNLTIKKIPGIIRPALLAILPTIKGTVAVIDVGGNLSCQARHLIQFANMGAAYQRCIANIQRPKVGILNIGAEASRGPILLKDVYKILKENDSANIHFIGNVEGRDVFQNDVDVLITDGFTGNIFLKTTEGASSFVIDLLESHLPKDVLTLLRKHFDYKEYPGAVLCGLERLIVKCHGDASKSSMLSCIEGTVQLVEKRLIQHLLKHANF